MAYGNVVVAREGKRITIGIDLPDSGEPSQRGRAENLVDPAIRTRVIQDGDELNIKLTVCRPYRRSRPSR